MVTITRSEETVENNNNNNDNNNNNNNNDNNNSENIIENNGNEIINLLPTNISLSGQTEVSTVQYDIPKINFYAMASAKAPTIEVEDTEQKVPMNVIAVLDISGSMKGEKIILLKETMQLLIEELRVIDKLSIITFSSNASILLPLTTMDEAGKSLALSLMVDIKAMGNTFLSGGLQYALDILPKNSSLDQINSVLLLTDGLANMGINSSVGINAFVNDFKLNSDVKFTIYTFGYCAGHNASFLKDISQNADGSYYFIENADQIKDSFADCLGGLMSIVGQQVQLTIAAAEGHTIKEILTKYKVDILEAGIKYRVTFGDVQSEETRDVPFIIDLPAIDGSVPSSPIPIANISLKYFNVVSNQMENFEEILFVKRDRKEDILECEGKNGNILKNVFRISAVNVMQKAANFGNSREYEKARKLLSDFIAEMEASSVANEPEVIILIKSMNDSMAQMNRGSYESKGSYFLSECMDSASQQRNNNICNKYAEARGFESKQRKCMKSKWQMKKF